MAPTDAEVAARNHIVEQLSAVVKERWPGCSLQVFGSFASGLFIPSSDIDMVLFNSGSSPVDTLNELARALRRTALYRDIVVISKARIPIIKFSDACTMLMLNIAVDVQDGIASSAFVKQLCSTHACLKPLVIVLKTFLRARDLHDTYHGGVGSYLLTLMVLAAVQQCPGICSSSGVRLEDSNLGALLIHFFDFWGRRFNYIKLGVRVNGRGSLFNKQAEGAFDRARPQLLSIEDPVSGCFDVGKNSFNIMMVRRAFEAAYYAITVPNSSDKRRSQTAFFPFHLAFHQHFPSLLARIIAWDPSVQRASSQRVRAPASTTSHSTLTRLVRMLIPLAARRSSPMRLALGA
jgi:non-canonical poly(A) RNA polymerase PAPD5/7